MNIIKEIQIKLATNKMIMIKKEKKENLIAKTKVWMFLNFLINFQIIIGNMIRSTITTTIRPISINIIGSKLIIKKK